MSIVQPKPVDRTSREYISKNPITSSIGAVGFGVCQSLNLAVDIIDVSRDVVKLAKLSIQTSVLEAQEENLIYQLESADRLATLKADLAKKQAELGA